MSISPPPADLTAYEIPTSLWSIVENNVPEHEREEVKNMLGSCLVDQSIELHQEAETFLEIWREYREETNSIQHMPLKRLPEPPAVRDRLRQEICFFVEQIREKSKRIGIDSMHILAKHNQDVLSYVMDQKRPGSSGYNSRPSTARSSRDGRETPLMRLDTPTSDRYSQTSAFSDEVDKMHDKLNILKLDEVITHLRQTLEEEIETLHGDIKFLQECLDDEADFRSNSSMGFVDAEPSLGELKEERNQLEKDLLRQESPIPEVLREKPRNSAKHPHTLRRQAANRAISPLKPSSGTNGPLFPSPPKPRSPGSGLDSSQRTRPGPMKASHSISSAQVLTVHRNNTTLPKSEFQSVNRSVLRKTRSLDRENQQLSETTSHVTVRTGSASSIPRSAKLVKVATVPKSAFEDPEVSSKNAEAYNSSNSRPSSASRFRRMVMGCRDDQEPTPVSGAS